MRLSEIDTPALLLDLDAMERNLAKMAGFFSAGSTRLRPHYKNHKCPALARRQIGAGAIGMTCATLAEAEALVANGIGNLLISSEIAGDQKIRRFVDLARHTGVVAVVDNAYAARALAAAGREKGCRIGVLVDINVGQNRTGVKPGKPAFELAPARCQGPLGAVSWAMKVTWRTCPEGPQNPLRIRPGAMNANANPMLARTKWDTNRDRQPAELARTI
jgi:D-serine deaminase-like pyridoxal phosphate-dependent protein